MVGHPPKKLNSMVDAAAILRESEVISGIISETLGQEVRADEAQLSAFVRDSHRNDPSSISCAAKGNEVDTPPITKMRSQASRCRNRDATIPAKCRFSPNVDVGCDDTEVSPRGAAWEKVQRRNRDRDIAALWVRVDGKSALVRGHERSATVKINSVEVEQRSPPVRCESAIDEESGMFRVTTPDRHLSGMLSVGLRTVSERLQPVFELGAEEIGVPIDPREDVMTGRT
jgi:hypothetical protein